MPDVWTLLEKNLFLSSGTQSIVRWDLHDWGEGEDKAGFSAHSQVYAECSQKTRPGSMTREKPQTWIVAPPSEKQKRGF